VNRNLTGPKEYLYSLARDSEAAAFDSIGLLISSPIDGDCYVTTGTNCSDILCMDKWWASSLCNKRNSSVSTTGGFFEGIAESLTTLGSFGRSAPTRRERRRRVDLSCLDWALSKAMLYFWGVPSRFCAHSFRRKRCYNVFEAEIDSVASVPSPTPLIIAQILEWIIELCTLPELMSSCSCIRPGAPFASTVLGTQIHLQ